MVVTMSRMDWKRGRWGAEVETQQIGDALRGYQPAFGDLVNYFRWDYAASAENNVYDEAVGVGRQFLGPVEVPVLHVTPRFGEDELLDSGFYTNETIQVVAGFRQLARTGLTLLDLRNGKYLRDRFAYDGSVFRVLGMNIQGKLIRSFIIVEINAVQLKPDEIVDDPQFAQYAVDPVADGS